jgi:hypothetical protein
MIHPPSAQPFPILFSTEIATNRFHNAAMTERLATWNPNDDLSSLVSRCIPTKELMEVHRHYGVSGFGVILGENIMISARGARFWDSHMRSHGT